jgi:hypothetical protein
MRTASLLKYYIMIAPSSRTLECAYQQLTALNPGPGPLTNTPEQQRAGLASPGSEAERAANTIAIVAASPSRANTAVSGSHALAVPGWDGSFVVCPIESFAFI